MPRLSEMRVLYDYEDFNAIALCLDFDIAAQGNSLEDARRNLIDALTLQAEAVADGVSDFMGKPSPDEEMARFERARPLPAPDGFKRHARNVEERVLPIGSLGILIGDGRCQAKCQHCAGQIHRSRDIMNAPAVVEKALKFCADAGATKLSISSAGEPLLVWWSIRRLLYLVQQMHLSYETVALYTNGIALGEDRWAKDFALWRSLGLTHVYLTAHAMDEIENARAFKIGKYPPFRRIFRTIHEAGLRSRVNLVLRRGGIDTADKLEAFVMKAQAHGAQSVAAWPKRGDNDKIATRIPESDLNAMVALSKRMRVSVYWPPRDYTHKRTLFPNGDLRNTWCR